MWKSIEYVLTATTFNEKECAEISKELYRPLLPILGCNRNFPLILRYNDTSLMGLGLANPYWEQGFAHIELLLSHGNRDTITGKLLTAMIEQHQLAIGCMDNIFMMNYERYKHLTENTWITNTWKFVSEYGIQLKCDDNISLAFPRKNDRTIMSEIMKLECMSIKEEIAFNKVRCYLQVLTISDIATGCGTKIQQNILEGKKSMDSRYEWHEEQPTKKDINIWKKTIRYLLDNKEQLKCPVGEWIMQSHLKWTWFYCQATDRIIQKKRNRLHIL